MDALDEILSNRGITPNLKYLGMPGAPTDLEGMRGHRGDQEAVLGVHDPETVATDKRGDVETLPEILEAPPRDLDECLSYPEDIRALLGSQSPWVPEIQDIEGVRRQQLRKPGTFDEHGAPPV